MAAGRPRAWQWSATLADFYSGARIFTCKELLKSMDTRLVRSTHRSFGPLICAHITIPSAFGLWALGRRCSIL
jgi:hypothetical protein